MSLRAGDFTIIVMIILYIHIYILVRRLHNYCRGFGCCSSYSDVRNVSHAGNTKVD